MDAIDRQMPPAIIFYELIQESRPLQGEESHLAALQESERKLVEARELLDVHEYACRCAYCDEILLKEDLREHAMTACKEHPLRQAEADLSAVRAELAEAHAELVREREEAFEDCESLRVNVAALLQRSEKAEADLAAAQAELAEPEHEHAALNSEMLALIRQIADDNGASAVPFLDDAVLVCINEQRKRADKSESDIYELECVIGRQRELLRQFGDEDREAGKLRAELASKDKRIDELYSEIESRAKENAALHDKSTVIGRATAEVAAVIGPRWNDLQSERDHLRAELAAANERAEKAEANYQFMVDRIADEKLDGYRDLGQRAEQAERERDHWQLNHADLKRSQQSFRDSFAAASQRAEKAEQEAKNAWAAAGAEAERGNEQKARAERLAAALWGLLDTVADTWQKPNIRIAHALTQARAALAASPPAQPAEDAYRLADALHRIVSDAKSIEQAEQIASDALKAVGREHHPDPEINAEVESDRLEARASDAAAGIRDGWHKLPAQPVERTSPCYRCGKEIPAPDPRRIYVCDPDCEGDRKTDQPTRRTLTADELAQMGFSRPTEEDGRENMEANLLAMDLAQPAPKPEPSAEPVWTEAEIAEAKEYARELAPMCGVAEPELPDYVRAAGYQIRLAVSPLLPNSWIATSDDWTSGQAKPKATAIADCVAHFEANNNPPDYAIAIDDTRGCWEWHYPDLGIPTLVRTDFASVEEARAGAWKHYHAADGVDPPGSFRPHGASVDELARWRRSAWRHYHAAQTEKDNNEVHERAREATRESTEAPGGERLRAVCGVRDTDPRDIGRDDAAGVPSVSTRRDEVATEQPPAHGAWSTVQVPSLGTTITIGNGTAQPPAELIEQKPGWDFVPRGELAKHLDRVVKVFGDEAPTTADMFAYLAELMRAEGRRLEKGGEP
jgi:chromosome segregation ATPase